MWALGSCARELECVVCVGKRCVSQFLGTLLILFQIQLQFVIVLASVYLQPVFQRLLRSPAGLKLEIGGEVGCSPSL